MSEEKFVDCTEGREALRSFYTGFSLPDAGFDEDLCEVMSVTHARATIERALARFPNSLRKIQPELQQALASSLCFDDVWCKAVPVTLEALGNPSQETGDRLADVLSEWSDGVNGSASYQDTTALVFSRDYGSFELAFADRLGPADDQFLREQALETSHAASVHESLAAAFDLIERYTPEYGPWIMRLLKRLIPLSCSSANACQSGSSRLDAGACHMAFPCEPEALAEMLVHEVTHQYYYLLTRVGRVEDGTDTALYFSPAKQCGRPIYFILIAYHAFANVLLFSHRCLAAGYSDPRGYLGRNVNELSEWVEIFERHLSDTGALTEIGTALWMPLFHACQSAKGPCFPVLETHLAFSTSHD